MSDTAKIMQALMVMNQEAMRQEVTIPGGLTVSMVVFREDTWEEFRALVKKELEG